MTEHETGEGLASAPAEMQLDFDAWADLSARLMGLDLEARLDLLDEAQVDVRDWSRWEEQYVLAIADDIAQGRMDRAQRYALGCAAEMERRSQAKAAPPPAEEPVAPKAEPPQNEPAPPPAVPAPAEQTPTYLRQDLARPLRPQVVTPPRELVATAMAFELPTAFRNGSLPFKKTDTPSSLATSTEPKHPPTAPGGDAQRLGGTQTVDAAALLQAALPFGGTPSPQPRLPEFPRMPLPNYASLHAELAAFPQRAPEIRSKYGIANETVQAALNRDWQARFDAYPETKAEWQRLVAQWQAWLAGQAR